MSKNVDWVEEVGNDELATSLELIARQSPVADVNYYVYLEAARRLRICE